MEFRAVKAEKDESKDGLYMQSAHGEAPSETNNDVALDMRHELSLR
jgi:hypothetical protein